MASKKQIREMILPGDQKLSVKEVDFEIVDENWDEYKLSDGTILRVKNVVARIFLQVDQDGNVLYNENGEPNAVIVGSQMVVPTTKKE